MAISRRRRDGPEVSLPRPHPLQTVRPRFIVWKPKPSTPRSRLCPDEKGSGPFPGRSRSPGTSMRQRGRHDPTFSFA
jgi:hypothetical protein